MQRAVELGNTLFDISHLRGDAVEQGVHALLRSFVEVFLKALAFLRQGFFLQRLQALQVVGQRFDFVPVVGQCATVFGLGPAHLAQDVGVQAVESLGGFGGLGVQGGAGVALLCFEVVTIQGGQAQAGACELFGKVLIAGGRAIGACLERALLFVRGFQQGFILRLRVSQHARCLGGLACLCLRGVPAQLGLRGV